MKKNETTPATSPTPEQPQGQHTPECYLSKEGKKIYLIMGGRYAAEIYDWSSDDVAEQYKQNEAELHAEAEANAARIVQCVNVHDQLVEALRDAHKMIHEIGDAYCRDKDGYLREGIEGWDAETDIKIEAALAKATQS